MGWKQAALEDIEATPVSGGITNVLHRVGAKGFSASGEKEPPFFFVVARVFGEAGNAVCDREAENRVTAALGQQSFGPKIHAIFGNGRLEEWLLGRRPLEPLEMLQTTPEDFVALNARKLAEMHTRCSSDVGVELWSQLNDWVAMAEKVEFPKDEAKAKKLKALNISRYFDDLRALPALLPHPSNQHGARFLEKASGAEKRARELLYEQKFCHMDLLSGNIMHSAKEGDMKFIDFEYAMNSWVGLDIANHFNAVPESCLILEDTFDVDKYYPNADVQKHFLKAYFEGRGIDIDQDVVQAMLTVVLEFSMLAELRWVIWGVVQAGASPVDFDYLGYCEMRYEKGFLRYREMRSACA